MAIKADKFSTYDVTIPVEGYFRIVTNTYFWCKEGDPSQAVMYDKYYPQCNKNKSIVERFVHVSKYIPNIEVVLIPVAFIPINPSDWAN